VYSETILARGASRLARLIKWRTWEMRPLVNFRSTVRSFATGCWLGEGDKSHTIRPSATVTPAKGDIKKESHVHNVTISYCMSILGTHSYFYYLPYGCLSVLPFALLFRPSLLSDPLFTMTTYIVYSWDVWLFFPPVNSISLNAYILN